MTESERFWSHVDKTSECWNWTSSKRKGYGAFGLRNRKTIRAHRWAYENQVKKIPAGLTVDHLCRNRSCVNPAHMELVTNKENILRGIGPTARNKLKTHCINGHSLADAKISKKGRNCRTCANFHNRNLYWKKRGKHVS